MTKDGQLEYLLRFLGLQNLVQVFILTLPVTLSVSLILTILELGKCLKKKWFVRLESNRNTERVNDFPRQTFRRHLHRGQMHISDYVDKFSEQGPVPRNECLAASLTFHWRLFTLSSLMLYFFPRVVEQLQSLLEESQDVGVELLSDRALIEVFLADGFQLC